MLNLLRRCFWPETQNDDAGRPALLRRRADGLSLQMWYSLVAGCLLKLVHNVLLQDPGVRDIDLAIVHSPRVSKRGDPTGNASRAIRMAVGQDIYAQVGSWLRWRARW